MSRLATPSDVRRMGSIALASFHPTQSFEWQQPNYSPYPIDALRAQRLMFKGAMMARTDVAMVVAEDFFDPNENESCPNVVTRDLEDEGDQEEASNRVEDPGKKVVVGFAMFILPPESERYGEFQDTDAIELSLPRNEGRRDCNMDHLRAWWTEEVDVKNRLFSSPTAPAIFLEMLAVHPHYTRRGHATRLIRSGLDLAIAENMKVGVISSEYSIDLLKRLNFQHLEDFTLGGDGISPRGVQAEVLEWRQTPASSTA